MSPGPYPGPSMIVNFFSSDIDILYINHKEIFSWLIFPLGPIPGNEVERRKLAWRQFFEDFQGFARGLNSGHYSKGKSLGTLGRIKWSDFWGLILQIYIVLRKISRISLEKSWGTDFFRPLKFGTAFARWTSKKRLIFDVRPVPQLFSRGILDIFRKTIYICRISPQKSLHLIRPRVPKDFPLLIVSFESSSKNI